MRISHKHIAIALALLLTQSLSAQGFLGVVLGANTAMYIDDIEMTTNKFTAGGEIQLSYQYQLRHFLLSVGAEMSYKTRAMGVADTLMSYPMTTSAGIAYNYDILSSNRTDKLKTVDLSFPFLLGAEVGYFYFLAGAKFRLNLPALTTAMTSAIISTEGDFGDFLPEPIRDAHDFSTGMEKSFSESVSLTYGIDASLELGGSLSFGANAVQKIRIGLFADIGVWGQQIPKTNARYTELTNTEPHDVNIYHLYTSYDASGANIRPMTIGLRLTYLLQVHGGQSGQAAHRASRGGRKYKCRCEAE